MNNILVIAAHPDDEVLGCGGTIRRLVKEGSKAYSLILSNGVTSRYNSITDEASEEINKRLKDCEAAGRIIGFEKSYLCQFTDNCFDREPLLDLVKVIEKYILLLKPSIIFTHHFGDLNIDHQLTFKAVQTATRPFDQCSVKEIYCFETFSSTEWNFAGTERFIPNYFVNIEETLKDKLESIKCYRSELREYPHPRSIEGLEVNARRWGTVVGCNYAEAFECIRKIVV